VLDRALAEAQITREDAYLTNIVKHFKWIPKGKRRLHKTPNAREIGACLTWLEAELDLIRPQILVCLGATAAKAILGAGFRVSADRGKLVESAWAPLVMATLHPSAILRLRTDEERQHGIEQLVQDLRLIAQALDESPSPAAPVALAGRRRV
jgi:DNA polymerase